jgi:7-carboxy-7-deazaguanine synthase
VPQHTPTPSETAPALPVTEIFHSIQGESTWAGLPCVFVRLTGCPLRCVWCDTAYAFHGGRKRTLDEIVREVLAVGCPLVEVTGGEPLAHAQAFALVRRLLDEGLTVLVETSGAVDLGPVDPRAHRIMDLKCPGSGEVDRNLWSNLDHLTSLDEIKFVIADHADWEWAADVIRERRLDERVRRGRLRALLASPVWGSMDLEGMAEWILASGLPVRFQTQLQKQIWGAERRGV